MPSDKFEFSFGADSLFAEDKVTTVLKALEENDSSEALTRIEEYRKSDGGLILQKYLMGLTMLRMSRLVPAVRLFKDAHEAEPNALEFVEVLAVVLALLGQRTEAAYFGKLSTALELKYPEYNLVPRWLVNFSVAFVMASENPMVDDALTKMETGDYDRAYDSLIDAITLNDKDRLAWETLVALSLRRSRPGDALKASEVLMSLAGDDPEVITGHSQVLIACGCVDEAWQTAQTAVTKTGGSSKTVENLISLVKYAETGGAEDIFTKMVDAWRSLNPVNPQGVPGGRKRYADEPFRVGVLTGSVRSATSKMAYLSTIDECVRRGADIHYYLNQTDEDSVARRLRRSATRWRVIKGVDDATVAEIIRNDGIQILFDLDGFETSGRPGVVALGAAPINLCIGAAPAALALTNQSSCETYSLTDMSMTATLASAAVPPLTLSSSLSSWPLFLETEEVDRGGHARSGPLRILIDGTIEKFSETMLAALSKAFSMGAAFEVLYRGNPLDDLKAQEIFEERCQRVGLNSERLKQADADKSLSHLILEADIFLDTYPVPSLDSVFHALRGARPVLCVRPTLGVNSETVSLLHGLGLSTWICGDQEELVKRLVEMARDPETVRNSELEISKAIEAGAGLEIRLDRAKALLGLFDELLEKGQS